MKTLFGGLLNLSIKLKFDKNSDILSATGMEEYLELLAEDPSMAGQVDAIKKQLSNEELARSMQTAKAVLPPKPVTLDDTWPVVIRDSKGVMEGTARLYEVVSTPEGDLATIKMTGKMKDFANMPGVEFDSGALDFESTMKVYVATGMAKIYELDMDGSIKMHSQGMAINMDMDCEIKMTMVPKK